MDLVDVGQFCVELQSHIEGLSLDVVWLEEQSGVRMPLSRAMSGVVLEDWVTLCYVCLWVRLSVGSLPPEFVSRMVLGPSNKWVQMLLHMDCTDSGFSSGLSS